jgi:hypothetical protein
VAMSFDPRFDSRWEQVIRPAIESIEANGKALTALRVNARKISDSILTEILGGITNALLIFADVTTLGKYKRKPIRNGNVMYEIGLAHAVRQPEEILLFRSDGDPLLFDTANVRVNQYAPETEPAVAKAAVADAIAEALKEVDLKRGLAVKSAAESLDFPCWIVMHRAFATGGIRHRPDKSIQDYLSNANFHAAISQLLERGILRTDYTAVTPKFILSGTDMAELINYRPTQFGRAVFAYLTETMWGTNPVIMAKMQQLGAAGPSTSE